MPRKRRTGRLTVALLLAVAVLGGGVYLALRHVSSILGESGCTAGTGRGAVPLDAEQAQIAATIAGVAHHRRMPPRALTVAYATAMQESHLHDPDYGDLDSVGVFQQRPSQGWGPASKLLDPDYAAARFFQALARVPGYRRMPVYKAAQAVQRSADGYAYAQYARLAAHLTTAFTGTAPRAVWCWPAVRPAGRARLAPARQAIVAAFGPLPTSGPAGGGASLLVRAPGERLGWSLAAWLVTHAGQYRLHEVRYAGFRWPAPGGHPGWVRSASSGPAGTVQAS